MVELPQGHLCTDVLTHGNQSNAKDCECLVGVVDFLLFLLLVLVLSIFVFLLLLLLVFLLDVSIAVVEE